MVYCQCLQLFYVTNRGYPVREDDTYMKKVIQLGAVALGQGLPKICVSLMGETTQHLIEEIHALTEQPVDLVEWRVDYFQETNNLDCVISALRIMRSLLGTKPLIFTFRSLEEGGVKSISNLEYHMLYEAVIQSNLVNMIDLELLKGNLQLNALVKLAHSAHMPVIISNHNFNEMPTKEVLINTIHKAIACGADMPKVAIMPQNMTDVLTLLSVSHEMDACIEEPLIAIAMGDMGRISRMGGEIFGSAVTFACITQSSASGQIQAKALKELLNSVHTCIENNKNE